MRRGGTKGDYIGGTRFRVYPQPPFSDPAAPPETIEISTPAGRMRAGPADERMYFVRPVGKAYPYGINRDPRGRPFFFLPPWTGPAAPPVEPGPDGHFDHLEPGTPEFEGAHLFAVTRFVMDVWERYLGHPIRWHFGADFEQLQLSVLPKWDNGQVGYGYLEVGSIERSDGALVPLALNFDVIAHELGHGLIYSEVGLPALDAESGEYFGFHEVAADWVAMIAALHFSSVTGALLSTTSGNLYTYNALNRFSEFSLNEEIRLASNTLKMSDFAEGWRDEHKLSQPLSGALFDIFVDIFHEALVEVGAIRRTLEDLADATENRPELAPAMQAEFDAAFLADPGAFVFALEEARDLTGDLLVDAWRRLSPDDLTYADFADAMIDADLALTGGAAQRVMLDNFRWREIGLVEAGPRIGPPGRHAHAFSARTAVPQDEADMWPMSYRQRHLQAMMQRGRCCARMQGS
ncbi:gluzincin family metallopeptidase [Mesorhizobium xinjiangense]|uniref:hypothetical protein n=1 Tax=Mesorhizobium xinjiangense TaxID=2678685 RepID=UPI0018DBAB74|nr:hypothetical protein [Mesorhizobium xinjiangense]